MLRRATHEKQDQRNIYRSYSMDEARTKNYVGDLVQPYAKAPQTLFQQEARKGMRPNEPLLAHVSTAPSEKIAEMVCEVALKPGADLWSVFA
jgi:hypothetical protein